MKSPWQEFSTPASLKRNLAERLREKAEIFSHHSDPLLASLISCLGLQFEIGRPGWDRLSAPLGVDLRAWKENPWQTEIISLNGTIGIRMWIPEVEEFRPLHQDFAAILHPLSIDTEGRLSQIVIFPADLAQNYRARGLELVIVRDWVLSSCLSSEDKRPVEYLATNLWELENNTARLQAELMANRQVAFSGTHDLADHLIGGSGQGFFENRELYQEVSESYRGIFGGETTPKNITLVVSYLIGALLDDLAQPTWYFCKKHRALTQLSLRFLNQVQDLADDLAQLELPESFDTLMHHLRSGVRDNKAMMTEGLRSCFERFCQDLLERATFQLRGAYPVFRRP